MRLGRGRSHKKSRRATRRCRAAADCVGRTSGTIPSTFKIVPRPCASVMTTPAEPADNLPGGIEVVGVALGAAKAAQIGFDVRVEEAAVFQAFEQRTAAHRISL